MGKKTIPTLPSLLIQAKLAQNRLKIHVTKKSNANAEVKREISESLAGRGTNLSSSHLSELEKIKLTSVVYEDHAIEVLQVLVDNVSSVVTHFDLLSTCLSPLIKSGKGAKPGALPPVLVSPICSIIYGAPYVFQQPELLLVRSFLLRILGKKFPAQCVDEECIDSRLVKRLASAAGKSKAAVTPEVLDFYVAKMVGGTTGGEGAGSSVDDSIERRLAALQLPDGLVPGNVAQTQGGASLFVVPHADGTTTQEFIAVAPDGNAVGARHGDAVLVRVRTTSPRLTGEIVEITARASELAAHGAGGDDDSDDEHVTVVTASLTEADFTRVRQCRLAVDRRAGHTWAQEIAAPGEPLTYVPTEHAGGAGHGDLVRLGIRVRPDGKRVGAVLAILERAGTAAQIVEVPAKVRLDPRTGNYWAVALSDDPLGTGNKLPPGFVLPQHRAGAADGDHVIAQFRPAPSSPGKWLARVLTVTECAPVEGVLSVRSKGRGGDGVVAIVGDGGTEYISVPEGKLAAAADGDQVLVQPEAQADAGRRRTGAVIRVLRRAPLLARVMAAPGGGGDLIADPPTLQGRSVLIAHRESKGAKPGDQVELDVGVTFENGHYPGKVMSVVQSAPEPPRRVAEARVVVDTKTGHMWAKDLSKGVATPIFVALRDEGGAEDGDVVELELHVRSDRKVSGRVVRVVRRAPPPAYQAPEATGLARPSAAAPPPPPLPPAGYLSVTKTSSLPPVTGGVRVMGTMSARALAGARLGKGMASLESSPVVLDNGSGAIKIGLAGEELPRAVFPSIVGSPKFPGVVVGLAKDTYVGDEAQAKRGILSLRYPLSNGVVTDWAGAETLWAHALTNELRVDPRERSLVLSEAPQNPREHRVRMAEIFFEKFGVRSLFIGVQAVLALYSSNATTGTVLDVGDGVSHVVPVYEGFVLPHAIQRLDLAGRDVTRTLASLLRETGTQLSSTAEFEVAREMKERIGFVRPSSAAEPTRQQLYTLPDGKVVEVGDQAWRCSEILFTPATVGKDEPGIGRLVTRAVERCDVDVRRPLYSNILLSGGATLMPGFAERLQAELPSHARVVSPPTRRVSVWCGGSVVGSLSTFEEMTVSRAEFAEEGPAVLARRFIS